MSNFKPFKAVRPLPAYAERVAALPYDVMTSDEAREIVIDNPHSFLHVDKAEIDLPLGTDLYSEEVYAKAAENLKDLETYEIMKQDRFDCYYIYEQTWQSRTQTGGDQFDWKVGDKASHGKWGVGMVVSVKGEGDGTELDVAFPAPTGIKRLLAKFAPITKA